MPDLLREQFPYFRPIVEAFGYRNLEFEGWEADDVIATLATRADEAGIKTCVVSTDRDAFQLVSENVCLMMTPRGVQDRTCTRPSASSCVTASARPGARLHRVEGRHVGQHPRRPRHRRQDRGPADLAVRVARGGDRARRRSSRRRGGRTSSSTPRSARESKQLATMRRDLDIECDPSQLVLAPPDRSQLREMFRRFEFRNLLNRIDLLDEAVPAAGRAEDRRQQACPGARSCSSSRSSGVGVRRATTTDPRSPEAGGVVVAPTVPARVRGRVVAHDAKTQRVEPLEDTMLAAYLIEPGRADVRARRPGGRVRRRGDPEPAADEETTALVQRGGDAAPAARAHARAAAPSAASSACTARSSCRSRTCSPRWRTPA